MLERIESPDTVLAVEVIGKLEKEDYQALIVPGLQALLDEYGAIRCVFVFGDAYQGLTVGGTVEDFRLSFSELVHGDLSKWRRCAVVTSFDWLRHGVTLFRFMMPGEVQCFEPSEVRLAVDWAAG
jgi:hypothetical protein